jgi:hypothetical protein
MKRRKCVGASVQIPHCFTQRTGTVIDLGLKTNILFIF